MLRPEDFFHWIPSRQRGFRRKCCAATGPKAQRLRDEGEVVRDGAKINKALLLDAKLTDCEPWAFLFLLRCSSASAFRCSCCGDFVPARAGNFARTLLLLRLTFLLLRRQ